MRALRIVDPTGPSGLNLQDVADPSPAKGQLLVRVSAVGLNRADLLQSMGLYPAPPGVVPDIPGLEYCGVVEKPAGAFKRGDRVMGLVPGGAFAEKLVVDAAHALKVPKQLSDTDAAALVEAYTTAWDALWLQAGAKKGMRLLIHAVGSGVGTAAVQLSRVFGLTSIGTSRTQAKLDEARPDVPLLVGDSPSFADRVGGADLCLDLVGGPYFPETLAAMNTGGTVMLVGLTAGPTADVPLRTLLSKRLRVIGTTLRARDTNERTLLTRRFARQIVPLFAKARLTAVVGAVRPMTDAQQSFEAMARNDTFGKTVLTW
jgi:NADPH:quinone reductase